jgi:hypothetical protein
MHKFLAASLGLVFAAAPSSTNFILKNYDVGSGGTGSSSSTNYKLNGVSGTQNGSLQTSTTYEVPSGEPSTQNVAVPAAPTLTNPSNYYNRLNLALNPGSAPSTTKYLIAISGDSFVTTRYVQADNSIGTSQAIANYQTYAAWGGASGFVVLGLSPSTTYQVKVKAIRGTFSGSGFGPTASAATVAPTLTISLATTLTSSPPFPVTFASLTPGSVVSGAADATIGLTSNAVNGGTVYARSTNAGLQSALAGTAIASASADLTAANTGYGAQVVSASQSSGGPLTAQSPFNGATNSVGGMTSSLQAILGTSASITSGTATIRLKAKASSITPSANDYSDVVTFVASMNF